MPRSLATSLRTTAIAVGTALPLAACGSSISFNPAGGDRIPVAAAENVWGSLASQLGGTHVTVTAIVANPTTDPHAYEPDPQDGRAIAQARYVIINGAGYDSWASKLVAANPEGDRTVLTIAELAGRREGDNPHMWYSPRIVEGVVDRMTRDLIRIDPADGAYFTRRAATLRESELTRYDDLRASVRSRFAGAPVASTESIFVDLAADLGLDLITPPDYMRAISEGTDPTAADKSTVDAQIATNRVRVLVFNRQNSTPDIQALVNRARARRIPVVSITETLDPPSSTFESWQADQLDALRSALARATGR